MSLYLLGLFAVAFSFPIGQAANPQQPILLWPDGAPAAVGKGPADIPTLTAFPAPKDKATGAAVIVCPGGGYSHLADHEGRPVAEWLNTLGISAFVLVSAPPSSPAFTRRRGPFAAGAGE